MELDRKVREFPLPEGISDSTDDLAASFERCVLEHIRETGTCQHLMNNTNVTMIFSFSPHVYSSELFRSSYH